MGIKLTALGAAQEVGRSGFIVDSGDKILLDYGVKLGPEGTEYPLPVGTNLTAAIISHAHLDHSGHLPALFDVSQPLVYMTPPTLEIAKLLWHDTLKIAGLEGMEAHFTKEEIAKTERFTFPLTYNKHIEITKKTGMEFYDAGHIIGSAITKLNLHDKTLVYTGDYKPEETRLFKPADLNMGRADFLITESTYGDSDHKPRKEVEKEFVEAVQDTIEHDGHVLVPAFAVARSQEIAEVLHEYKIDAPIYLDGMAQAAARIFMQYPKYLKNSEFLKKALHNVHWVDKPKVREMALKEPSIVITTSGMLQGGPIQYYLKKLYNDKKSSLFLTGFQVSGTPGRILMDTGKINLNGTNVKLEMNLKKFDFSGHPGKTEMLNTIKKLNPEKVICVHGDAEIIELFMMNIEEQGFEAVAPKRGETISLC